MDNCLADPDILECLHPVRVHLKSDDPATIDVHQLDFFIILNSGKVLGGTGEIQSTPPDSRAATRVAFP